MPVRVEQPTVLCSAGRTEPEQDLPVFQRIDDDEHTDTHNNHSASTTTHSATQDTAELLKLPRAIDALVMSLRDLYSLVETLLKTYKQIVVSFEDCADVLCGTELRLAGDDVREGHGCGGAMQWSLSQVTNHIDERLSEEHTAEYTAVLKAKVLDRVLLIRHGAVTLQAATQRVIDTRSAIHRLCEEEQQERQRKHSWKQKLTRSLFGKGSKTHGGSGQQQQSAKDTTPVAQQLLALEKTYQAAKDEELTAKQQLAMQTAMRLGPAFQGFLLGAVALVADLAVLWESGQGQPPVEWMSRASDSQQPSPHTVSLNGTVSDAHHGHTRTNSLAAAAPSAMRTPSCQSALPASQQSPMGHTLRSDTGVAATPVLTSFEHGSAKAQILDVAIPAIDGIRDVRAQAASIADSIGRVVAQFCQVASALQSATGESGDLFAEDSATTQRSTSCKGDAVEKTTATPTTPCTVAKHVTPDASLTIPSSATLGGDVATRTQELLRYMVAVREHVHGAFTGPRSNWYAAKIDEDVLRPLRRLAHDKRRMTYALNSSSDISPFGDVLRRAADGITMVAKRSGSDLPTGNSSLTRTFNGVGWENTVHSRQNSTMASPAAAANNTPPSDTMTRQQAAELEQIWAEFVDLSARYFAFLAETIDKGVDYRTYTS